jgi:hypothetical protein
MTPRTPQGEVFWPLLSNPKHSGVPEDSKSPTLEVLGFTPTLGQSGVATLMVNYLYFSPFSHKLVIMVIKNKISLIVVTLMKEIASIPTIVLKI